MIQEGEQEKQEAIEQATREMERQHKQLMSQAEGRYQNQVSDAQSQIAAKEIEVEVMRERMAQQETTAKNLQEKIRTEAQDRVRFSHMHVINTIKSLIEDALLIEDAPLH